LAEDSCVGPRVYWDECLEHHSENTADFGFFGEDRYERANGTQYSSCIKEDPSDTLVRAAIELNGLPSFLRIGEFEICGIISSWTRNNTCPVTYSVTLADTRIILQGVSLIISDYAGRVDQTIPLIDGGTNCPSTNLFNVFGFAEQFGLYCPEFSQCAPCVYASSATCPTAVDGIVHGSPFNGFGGSNWNEQGMPCSTIQLAFNLMANTLPATPTVFSPYGRVVYAKTDIPISLVGDACGLMQPDESVDACTDLNNFYFVDISELPTPPINYRFSGTAVTLMEVIDRLSQDFGFEYYVDLVPVKVEGTPCVYKFIKIRVVYRTTQPNLDAICSFIESADCQVESTIGRELRSETTSRFIIGGNKYSIYQACQSTDPEGVGDGTIASIDSCAGETSYVTNTGCTAIDDMIVPYFGTHYNGDLIDACLDASGYWYFNAPTFEVNSSLQCTGFSSPTITIGEKELLSALAGFENWKTYISVLNTPTWQAISQVTPTLALRSFGLTINALVADGKIAARDLVNPHVDKFGVADDPLDARCMDDEENIYQWVFKYASDYYGKRFAVRVPFSCCWADYENGKLRVSDLPSNDGGWTEVPTVIGLYNGGPLSVGAFEYLNFFRAEDGRILPFVKFTCALLLDTTSLAVDDYFYYYNITDGLSDVDSGAGPPSAVPMAGANRVYIDTLSNQIYIYYYTTAEWLPIQAVPTLVNSGVPSNTTVCAPASRFGTLPVDIPIYIDKDTCTVYISYKLPDYTETDGTVCANSDIDYTIEATVDLYVKAQVEETYKFFDHHCCFAPRVVVEIPQAIMFRNNEDSWFINGIEEAVCNYIDLVNSDPVAAGVELCVPGPLDCETLKAQLKTSVLNSIGGPDAWINIQRRSPLISAAAFPIRSTTISYGPWTNPSSAGGNIEVTQDPGLVPWNFGSYAGMNTAGQFLADAGRTDMLVGEVGSITVPGHPSLPLGAEIGAVAGGYYGAGTHLVENRSLATTNYSGTSVESNPSGAPYVADYGGVTFGSWTGLYGPNITSISVSVGCPIQTTYQMRTFSPRKLGLDKWLVDQVQKINTNTQRQVEYVRRLLELERGARLTASIGARAADKRQNPQGEIKRLVKPMSCFVGQNIDINGNTRPLVEGSQTAMLSEEMQNSYDNKAFMSIDGLLRPVSMDGGGGLPAFYQYGDYFTLSATTADIFQDDLIPLTNPGGMSRNIVSNVRSDTPNVGHDFDMVGRSGISEENPTPSGGLIMNCHNKGLCSVSGAYTDDYRYMALRGPLVMQSWGYDLDGIPVPNKVDTQEDAVQGIFEDDPNVLHPSKFMDGHLQKAHTWAVAPIDLRLDRERGVWVAGSGGYPIKASYECVVGNYIKLDNCEVEATPFRPKALCFGAGISIDLPCSGDETSWEIDETTGDLIICDPISTTSPSVLKIGASIFITNALENPDVGCIYQDYTGYVGTIDNPLGQFYRERNANIIVLDNGFITQADITNPCKLTIGLAGITYTQQFYSDLRCESVITEPTGTEAPFLQSFRLLATDNNAQFNCGLLGDTPTSVEDYIICDFTKCCSQSDSVNDFEVVGVDGGTGQVLDRSIQRGATLAVNSNNTDFLNFTVTNTTDHWIEITGVNVVGDYFDSGPTMSPTLITQNQAFLIQVPTNTTGSSVTLRHGLLEVTQTSGTPFVFGVMGLVI